MFHVHSCNKVTERTIAYQLVLLSSIIGYGAMLSSSSKGEFSCSNVDTTSISVSVKVYHYGHIDGPFDGQNGCRTPAARNR